MKKVNRNPSGSSKRTVKPVATTSPRPSTASSSAAARELTDRANFVQVKKLVSAFYKTPQELKIPGWDREASRLQLFMHPCDLVPAVEAVSSVVERGGATSMSLVVTVERNGPLTLFYRRKCEIREKNVLTAVEQPEIVPVAAMKLMKTINKSLAMHNLQVLELVGLEIPSPSMVELAQGLSCNKSLATVCFNDSEIGDKGLLAVLPSLQDHPKIARLQLCRTGITDVSGRKLMEILRVQAERQTLLKWENSLRKEAQPSAHGGGVRVIAVSHNDLGSETFLALVNVLGLESSLKEIYARGCNPCLQSSNELQRCLDDTTAIRIFDLREARNVPGWIYDARSHTSLIFERSDLGQHSCSVSSESLQETSQPVIPDPARNRDPASYDGHGARNDDVAMGYEVNQEHESKIFIRRKVQSEEWNDDGKYVKHDQISRQLRSTLPAELAREIRSLSDELNASKGTVRGIPRQRSCEDLLGDFARSAAKRRPFRTQLKRVDCLLDDPWVNLAGSREEDPACRALTVKEACDAIREMRSMFRRQNVALLRAHQELITARLDRQQREQGRGDELDSSDDEWTKSLERTIGVIAEKVEALEAARDRKEGSREHGQTLKLPQEDVDCSIQSSRGSRMSDSLELVAGRLEEMWGGDSEED